MIDFDFNQDYILEDDMVQLVPLTKDHITHLLPIAEEQGIWNYSFAKGHDITHLTNYLNAIDHS